MSYNLSGFVQVDALADNTTDVVAAVGELSSIGQTYTRDKNSYMLPDFTGVRLVSFDSYNNDVKVPLDGTYGRAVLDVAQYLVDQAWAGTLNSSTAECTQLLNANFSGTYTFADVGLMVTEQDIWLPEYVILSVVGAEDNSLRFWFSDTAFRVQYDRTELIALGQVDDVDFLMGLATDVIPELDSFVLADFNDKVQRARGDDAITYPPTTIVFRTYDWYALNDETQTHPTNWAVLIYGSAGNNEDRIRQALQNYILSHSTHTENEWKQVLPDLFIATEFMIYPLWDKLSVPNLTSEAWIYSPLATISELTTLVTTAFPYNSTHTAPNAQTLPSIYKSVSSLICGAPDNRDGIYKLSEKFSDYALIRSTSIDFGRLSPETQDWIGHLQEGLMEAESMTEYSIVRTGFSRVIRDGVPYVAFVYDNVTYLIVARYYHDL